MTPTFIGVEGAGSSPDAAVVARAVAKLAVITSRHTLSARMKFTSVVVSWVRFVNCPKRQSGARLNLGGWAICSVWVTFAQRRCLFAPLCGLVHARAKKIKAAWISLRRGGRSVSRLRGGNRLEAGIEAAGGYAFEGCQGKQVVVLEF